MNPVLAVLEKNISNAVVSWLNRGVNLKYPENIIGVPGVSLGVAATGEKDKDDLVIVRFEEGSSVAGVFTNSAFAALLSY